MKTLLTYTGIRVRNMDRSKRFYSGLLGLKPAYPEHPNKELGSRMALLRYPTTGHQLELNWYPKGGQFGVPFASGESLDHFGVRVDDVPAFLKAARRYGGEIHDMRPYRDYPFHKGPDGATVGYVDDPDGNIREVYDAPAHSVAEERNGVGDRW